MDFSKLDQNERMAAIASAVLVVAGIVAAATYGTYGVSWLAVIAAIGMLFVVLQPQIATGVNLPGSKGSLMLVLGGVAGVIMVLALLATLGFVFVRFGFADLLFLLAVAAGVVMAWAGWQEFQREGGKFQLGTTTGTTASGTTATGTAETTAPPPSATTAAPPPSEPAGAPPPSATMAAPPPSEPAGADAAAPPDMASRPADDSLGSRADEPDAAAPPPSSSETAFDEDREREA